jgi:hypothetical protein
MLPSLSSQATSGSTIHPELGQVPAGLRLLGPEGRSEAVHLAEHRRGRFQVELTRLGEVRRAEVEVLGLEQRAGRFADRPGQNRRVDEDEIPLVEEVPDRPHHLVPDPHDRGLPGAPEPQVSVLEQKIGAVLLGLDGELRGRADQLDPTPGDLVAGGSARVLPNHAADLDAGLVAESLRRLPAGSVHLVLREHDLHLPGAVAQDDEEDLPARPMLPHPAS